MKSDWSLVGFTLLAQTAVGAAWGFAASWALLARRAGPEIAGAATAWGMTLVPVLVALALGVSLLHLGRPGRALLALVNLRSSWLSREILATAVFFAASSASLVVPGPQRGAFLPFVAGAGAGLLWAMVGTYRIHTVPAWNSWATPVHFLFSVTSLGGLSTALVLALASPHPGVGAAQRGALLVSAVTLVVAPVFVAGWRLVLVHRGGVAVAEAFDREASRRWRHVLLAYLAASLVVVSPGRAGTWRVAAIVAALIVAIAAEAQRRRLFYLARVRSGL